MCIFFVHPRRTEGIATLPSPDGSVDELTRRAVVLTRLVFIHPNRVGTLAAPPFPSCCRSPSLRPTLSRDFLGKRSPIYITPPLQL